MISLILATIIETSPLNVLDQPKAINGPGQYFEENAEVREMIIYHRNDGLYTVMYDQLYKLCPMPCECIYR